MYWLFLGLSSSQTNLVFPDIIDGCTFSYENWALWSLHLCHHCRLIGFLQRWFSLIFNFPQTSTYLVPSLQGRFNQLDEDDATSWGHQHWKQESFTSKNILGMMLSQQKWLEPYGQVTTVIQLPGNNWWDWGEFHTILKQIFKWKNLIQWNCNWAWVRVAQIICQRERFSWWWETPGRGCLVHTGGLKPY